MGVMTHLLYLRNHMKETFICFQDLLFYIVVYFKEKVFCFNAYYIYYIKALHERQCKKKFPL